MRKALAAAAVLLGSLFFCLLIWCMLRWPRTVTAAAGGVILLGMNARRLLLRFVPGLVAERWLNRYIRFGEKARVVCFGDLETGEEPGFQPAFDTVLHGGSRLRSFIFSAVEPQSLAAGLAEHRGREAEVYCYSHRS